MTGCITLKLPLAAFAAAVIGSAAGAATVTVSQQGSSVFGTPNYSEVVNISSPGFNGNANAGAFRVTDGGTVFGDFVAWCVDLAETLNLPGDYDLADSSGDAGVDTALAGLFENSLDDALTGDIAAAGFQVAIWEIITDYDDLDIADGDFTLNSDLASVGAAATAYLGDLTIDGPRKYKLNFLTSDDNQDLVTVSQVPLPASVWLLGMGLAGLAGAARRRAG